MRGIAVAISSAVLGVALALPSLLWAQEAPPVEPPAAVEEPTVDEPPVAEEEEPPLPEEESTDAAPPVYAAAAAQGAGSVSMGDDFFSPATITINAGDTVTWSNVGANDHTATANGFDTGTVAPGGSASHTFSASGTFPYVCALHPDMTGTVQVVGDTGTDPGGDPGDPTGTAPTGTSTDPTAAPGTEAAAALEGTQPGELPATGEPEGALILLGVGLFCCGLLAAATARLREREVLNLTDRPSSLP